MEVRSESTPATGATPKPARSMTAPDTAVVFQGKTYGFADEYGAKQFASQPEKYVARDARDARTPHAGAGADHRSLTFWDATATARACRRPPKTPAAMPGSPSRRPRSLARRRTRTLWSVTSISRLRVERSGRKPRRKRCTRPTYESQGDAPLCKHAKGDIQYARVGRTRPRRRHRTCHNPRPW